MSLYPEILPVNNKPVPLEPKHHYSSPDAYCEIPDLTTEDSYATCTRPKWHEGPHIHHGISSEAAGIWYTESI